MEHSISIIFVVIFRANMDLCIVCVGISCRGARWGTVLPAMDHGKGEPAQNIEVVVVEERG